MDEQIRKRVRVHKDLSDIGRGVIADFEETLHPAWNAQLDLVKTLLSLGAGTLTLLATFGQSLVTRVTSPAARVLYGCTLSLLIITVILAVATRWRAIKVSEFRLLMNKAADRLSASAVASLEAGRLPDDIAASEIEPVRREIASALHWTDRLFKATLIVFVLGFMCLGLLAWVIYET
jgi:hypothetical protein